MQIELLALLGRGQLVLRRCWMSFSGSLSLLGRWTPWWMPGR